MNRVKPWLVATVAFVAFLAMVAAMVAAVGLWREYSFNRCGLTPPTRAQVGTGYHVRFDLTPPGWVCVYTDRQGRIVREERP